MRRGMRKPRRLEMRCYVAHLIGLNEYFALFPGVKSTDKIGVTEQNEILLNSMPNICSKQVYVQVIDYESITLKYLLIFLKA